MRKSGPPFVQISDKFSFRTFTPMFLNLICQQVLEVKEGELGSLSNMQENAEGVKTFVAEVMTHGADLKFLTISGQKFIDISKVI